MRLRYRVAHQPDGDEGYASQSAQLRLLADSSTVTTIPGDEDGWLDYRGNGHLAPYALAITSVPGGDKFIRSDDVGTAGVLSLQELPVPLRALGDGVIRGYEDELLVMLDIDSVTVRTGAANIAGHPFVVYDPTTIPFIRPVSSTRIDRVVIHLYPEGSTFRPGLAFLALIAGVEGGTAPALTQTADVYQISLAQIAIPTAGTPTKTDERVYVNERLGAAGEAERVDPVLSSTNTSGAALPGMSVDLVLPQPVEYVVESRLTTRQRSVTATDQWLLTQTQSSAGVGYLGLYPSLTTPGQIAINTAGDRLYIADTGNTRLVVVDPTTWRYVTSIGSLPGITGVCVDSSNNIYVSLNGGTSWTLKSFDSALALRWTNGPNASPTARVAHVATDGSTLFIPIYQPGVSALIMRRLCSTGGFAAAPTSFGSLGSANGQFNTPWGIVYNSVTGGIHVVDSGNSRVQGFSTTGAYAAQFPIPSDCRGIAADASGNFVVGDTIGGSLLWYTTAGTATSSLFIASNSDGITIGPGDVIWVANPVTSEITARDHLVTPGGYGEVALEIDGNLGAYLGIGNRNGALTNTHAAIITGPKTVTVTAFGKATTQTMTLSSSVLHARADPRS